MDVLLHNSCRILFFLLAPIAMILEGTFVALVRRKRGRSAQRPAPASRHTPAPEQKPVRKHPTAAF
jgi:hypothetical protein